MEECSGRALRNRDFKLDPKIVHLTQGSWGTAPHPVFNARLKYLEELEECPDKVFRFQLEERYYKNLEAAAKFLNLNAKNIVFVDNATTAINTVMKTIPLQKGDEILVYSWTYKAIRNTCMSAAEKAGASLVCADLQLPVTSTDQVIQLYRKTLQDHPNIKVVVLDYISSATATLFPIKELVALCNEHGVISIIDGAHTPGQVQLDIENLGADFYTGNLHKWTFVPRGCAVLWVNPKHHSIIQPLITSGFYNTFQQSGDFRINFIAAGTKDFTPYYCVEEGIKYYQSLGGFDAIQSYNHSILEEAVEKLVWMWGTRRFPIPKDMEAPYMRIIELPYMDKYIPKKDERNDDGVYHDMPLLIKDLWDKYKIMTTMLLVEEKPYIRICCHCYNYPEEYVKVGDAILSLKRQADEQQKS